MYTLEDYINDLTLSAEKPLAVEIEYKDNGDLKTQMFTVQPGYSVKNMTDYLEACGYTDVCPVGLEFYADQTNRSFFDEKTTRDSENRLLSKGKLYRRFK